MPDTGFRILQSWIAAAIFDGRLRRRLLSIFQRSSVVFSGLGCNRLFHGSVSGRLIGQTLTGGFGGVLCC
jgi:hypothetical protein